MIDYIKIYYSKKNKFELSLLREGNFKNISKRYALNSKKIIYPILAKEDYFTYKVNKYKGFVYGDLKCFYFSTIGEDCELSADLTYQKMCEAIDTLNMKLIDIENSRITQLYFGFTINLDFKAEDFIRKNLLMYAYKGYNHNKSSTSKKNLKIFDYEEFEIMFSADKVQDDFKQNNLKVELRIKESSALKKLGVKTILDLKYKEVLKKLFNIFLNKYDNLVIINSVINPEQFIIKDKIKMPLYMNPDYWVELPKEKNRQAKYRARKDFERIQRDYSLNTLKKELRESLISAFNNFINK